MPLLHSFRPSASYIPDGRCDPRNQEAHRTGSKAQCLGTQFLYRHIRKVVLRREGDYFIAACSCGNWEAVCSPCTHMFGVLKTVVPNLQMSGLQWHNRCKKQHYFNALFESDCGVPLKDMIDTTSVAPKVEASIVDAWVEQTQSAASTSGVPREGRLSADFRDWDDCEGDVGEPTMDDGVFGGDHSQRRRTARPAAPNKYFPLVAILAPPVVEICDTSPDESIDEMRESEHNSEYPSPW